MRDRKGSKANRELTTGREGGQERQGNITVTSDKGERGEMREHDGRDRRYKTDRRDGRDMRDRRI